MSPDRTNRDRTMFSPAWQRWRADVDLDEYEVRWDRLAADGHDVHGEADFVVAKLDLTQGTPTVLDAGCGMGRVGIELAARGCEVVGVDLDPDLLARAQKRAPEITWITHDLATLELDRTFDLVVLAGNVLPFAHREACPAIVAGLARHVAPEGSLILGESLRPGWPTVEEIEVWASLADLEITERYAGWDCAPWPAATAPEQADYLVATLTKSMGSRPLFGKAAYEERK